MRKSHLLAILAATVLLIVLAGFHATAQAPPRTATGPPSGAPVIALLDVSYVFKNHIHFKQRMEEMKNAVEQAEAAVKADRQSIMQLRERLKDFNPGSPDYKLREEEVAKREADLVVRIKLQRKEFLGREAKIYYNVYQEILQEVDYYAAARGIAMVLRFNGDPVDVDRPDDVIRQINKPVVWYARDRDITKPVLDQLNRRAFNPRNTTPPGANPIGTRPAPGVPFHR